MDSCIYTGTVAHTRLEPRLHRFQYRVYMMYVDVEKVDEICSKSVLWARNRRFWPAAFLRQDYHGNASAPLKESLQATIFQQTGKRHTGPIYMLANWRLFGINFNPLTTYYCFDEGDPNPRYIIAEVTNTPWRERHAYVLPCSPAEPRQHHSFNKAMHVSPFHPMEMNYEWRSNTPDKTLGIQLVNKQHGKTVFHATLKLERMPATAANLNKTVILFPLMTVKVIAAIYWQALKLWVKRIPLFDHPKYQSTSHTFTKNGPE